MTTETVGESLADVISLPLQRRPQDERSLRTHEFSVITEGKESRGLISFRSDQSLDTACYISPAYGGIQPGYHALREELASIGVPAVTVDPIGPFTLNDYSRPSRFLRTIPQRTVHYLDPLRYQSELNRRVMAHSGMEFGINAFHTVGHSLGGLTLVKTLENQVKRPWPFDSEVLSLTLLQSAGTVELSLFDLYVKANECLIEGFLKCRRFKQGDDVRSANPLVEMAEYIAADPLLTALRGLSCAKRLRQRLTQLKDSGIYIEAIGSEDDRLFKASSMRKYLGDSIHNFVSAEGYHAGHFLPQIEPKVTASLIKDAIDRSANYATSYPLFLV